MPLSSGKSRSASSMYPVAVRISDFNRVVLPVPLRPIRAMRSPREMLAVKLSTTVRPSYDFLLSRSYLARTRTGRETGDEFVELGDLLFALLILRLDARANLRLGQH